MLNKLFKRRKYEMMQERLEEVIRDSAYSIKKDLSYLEKHPEGLPTTILRIINYSDFGAMLKREQLLPPSYDKTPIRVDIDDICGVARVKLTFKSKTTENERFIEIFRYIVSYSENMETALSDMQENPKMSEVWSEFVEYVVWTWKYGNINELLNPEAKKNLSSIISDGKTLINEQTVKNNKKTNRQKSKNVQHDKKGNTFHFE